MPFLSNYVEINVELLKLIFLPFFLIIEMLSSADIISCVEFNEDGELLATGDKGGRVVIFQVRGKGWRILGSRRWTRSRRMIKTKT